MDKILVVEDDEVLLKEIDLDPVQALFKSDVSLPLYGTGPKSQTKSKILSVAPVFNDAQLQGYLYVIIGGEQYDSIVDSLQKNKGIQQFFMAIVPGTLFLFCAFSDDMDSFRHSGFNLETSGVKLLLWKDDSRNKVQRLGYSFNEMLKHIDLQWEKLQSTGSERRSLLADLSHDLRTPLAKLQGYVETLAL